MRQISPILRHFGAEPIEASATAHSATWRTLREVLGLGHDSIAYVNETKTGARGPR